MTSHSQRNRSARVTAGTLVALLALFVAALLLAFFCPESHWYVKPEPPPEPSLVTNPMDDTAPEPPAEPPKPPAATPPAAAKPLPSAMPFDASKPTLAFMGDSVSMGLGCPERPREICTDNAVKTASDLIGYDFNYLNLSKGKERSEQFAAEMASDAFVKKYITDYNVKYVMLMLGTNDALAGGIASTETAENFRTSLELMIRQLRAGGVEKIILNRAPYIKGDTRANTLESNDNQSLTDYYIVEEQLAQEFLGVYLGERRAAEIFWESNIDYYDPNGIHPKNEGHKLLGKRWADVFRQALDTEMRNGTLEQD